MQSFVLLTSQEVVECSNLTFHKREYNQKSDSILFYFPEYEFEELL